LFRGLENTTKLLNQMCRREPVDGCSATKYREAV